MSENPTRVEPSDEHLVALNRDHHRRMAEHARRRGAQNETRIVNKDINSRAALISAMKGCAMRFGVLRSGDLLELGAGRGGDRTTLEEELQANYTGIEVVPEIAELSGSICCSIETLPDAWTNRFKWIYSRHVMEHVLDVHRGVSNLARVLDFDGIIGAVTPHYFPDSEPAHVTQLKIGQWMRVYRDHGLIPVYASEACYNCAEAHLVLMRRDFLEQHTSELPAHHPDKSEITEILAAK